MKKNFKIKGASKNYLLPFSMWKSLPGKQTGIKDKAINEGFLEMPSYKAENIILIKNYNE